jgi:hypothetical protein
MFGAGGNENHGVAHGDPDGSFGLAGHFSGLNGDRMGSIGKSLADSAQASILELENSG